MLNDKAGQTSGHLTMASTAANLQQSAASIQQEAGGIRQSSHGSMATANFPKQDIRLIRYKQARESLVTLSPSNVE